MWAFAITEEQDGLDPKYILSNACDFATARNTMLSYLSLVVSYTRMGLLTDTPHHCQAFLDGLLEDGSRLSELEDADPGIWSGETAECGEHGGEHRMTYWIRPMDDDEYAATETMFSEAFPGGNALLKPEEQAA